MNLHRVAAPCPCNYGVGVGVGVSIDIDGVDPIIADTIRRGFGARINRRPFP